MINAIQTALSGLAAASKKIDASASNIANLTTEGSLTDPENPPYSSVTTVQQARTDNNGNGNGVTATVTGTNFCPSFNLLSKPMFCTGKPPVS